MIEIDDVVKSFDPKKPLALDKISAEIPKGQIVGLAGPDGSGKTTLIRIIAGLLLPTSGSVRVGGFDTRTQQAEISEIIGYMPQKFGLYEDLTVMENLVLYADLQGIVGEDRSEKFNALLEFTQLAPFTKRLSGQLSGGMKQKLGLACTLIRKPQFLLLDEPSVGVDPISRRELWKMVHDLLPQGISVVWSTAYLDEAAKCDKVLLLNEGKLLYQGPPGELTKRVATRTFTIHDFPDGKRKLFSDIVLEDNVVDCIIQGDSLRVVLNDSEPHRLKDLPDLKLIPSSPRFEDAFIDLLGGISKGKSKLAEQMPLQAPYSSDAIQAENLTKKFGSFTAADNITFEIKQGEIFGLLGPNGAGKSTTFKMLCGLLTPTSGKAFVLEHNLAHASSIARSHVGYMAQKFSLYGDLSVYENLNFFAGIYNLRGKEKNNSIDKMIDIFHFSQYLDEKAITLPLGFKQRLALAAACMHNPEVLFLDEPTSGVDPLIRREFWNHINGLVGKGVTIMVTTHFMEEAEYCDRIALIYKSKIITMGSPEDLKNQARTKERPNPTLEDAFVHLIEEYDR